MDITCKLAQHALQGGAPLRISYLHGGIGAVAWTLMITQRRSEDDTLVAFSGGSLLNLAQGTGPEFHRTRIIGTTISP